jgi:hypothetical protein
MVVKAVAVETPVRTALRLGEWEMWGRDECGEEGRAPHPFYRVGGGAGRLDREGDRAAGGGGINAGRPVQSGREMEG